VESNRTHSSLDDARRKAVDILSEEFAHDRLSLEEFEELVSRVQKAGALSGIQAVLERLQVAPAGADDPPAASPAATGLSLESGRAYGERASQRDTDSAVAVLGETKRTGHWVPARKTKVVATLGSVELDLRDAALGPGEFEFDVKAILGSVEIIAPEGLQVECGGSAILGSIDPGRPTPAAPGVGRPIVRLNCMAVLGEVSVDFRLPGETKRQAKRRRKLEDRQRKRLAAGRSRVERGFGGKLNRFFDRQSPP
jgi:hypothetical protein